MGGVCHICGNERESNFLACHFCGARFADEPKQRGPFHRVINLEAGRPPVEQALARLAMEIDRARLDRVAILTIIHGYGASGQGGAIRKECRKVLEFYKEKNIIQGYIAGENFSRKTGPTKALLRRLPQLLHNANLNRNNRGISIVEM